MAKQNAAASATAGLAASEAVSRVSQLGLGIDEYRIPIAITVALVVKAIWEQLDEAQDDDVEPPDR